MTGQEKILAGAQLLQQLMSGEKPCDLYQLRGQLEMAGTFGTHLGTWEQDTGEVKVNHFFACSAERARDYTHPSIVWLARTREEFLAIYETFMVEVSE